MNRMQEELFVPVELAFDRDTLWFWYQNIAIELAMLELCEDERAAMVSYYEEAGLLTQRKLAFFRRHFTDTFSIAVEYLFGGHKNPVIVDLGSGMGTQSLFFALCGARVHAVDMDELALSVLKKRKAQYEKLAGRSLAIDIHTGPAHDVDYASFGGIDGVYSMFAFNMMQPSDSLVDRIFAGLSPGARVAIIDGNNKGLSARLMPSRRRDVWSPDEFARQFIQRGFHVSGHAGGISFPPLAWALVPFSLIAAVDSVLNRNWVFPISHQLLAERD